MSSIQNINYISSYQGTFIQYQQQDQKIEVTPVQFQQIFREKIPEFSRIMQDFKICFVNYKQIRQNLKQVLRSFQKMGFIDDLFELLFILASGEQIFTNKYYQVLPIILNNSLKAQVLEKFSLEPFEMEFLKFCASKLEKQCLKKFQLTNRRNFQNNHDLNILNFKKDNSQLVVSLRYSDLYSYLQDIEKQFQQNGVIEAYMHYKLIQQCQNELKSFFFIERKLYQLLTTQDISKLPNKKLSQIARIHPEIDIQDLLNIYQIKLEQFEDLSCLRENICLKQLSKLTFILQNQNYNNSNYNTNITAASPNQQFKITSKGDDFTLQIALTSISKFEDFIFELKNKGLHGLIFAQNSQYFIVLQYWQVDVYKITTEQLLHLEINLDYLEERYLNVIGYQNDERLIILSDCRIRIQVFDSVNQYFYLEQVISLSYCTSQNIINIIQDQDQSIIEVKSKTNSNQTLYCQIIENNGCLMQYYII